MNGKNHDERNRLLCRIDRIHTTALGAERIKRNLGIDSDDAVGFCKSLIAKSGAAIERRGKNWYVSSGDCRITVNASSFTVITAHKVK